MFDEDIDINIVLQLPAQSRKYYLKVGNTELIVLSSLTVKCYNRMRTIVQSGILQPLRKSYIFLRIQ